jgi:hypothetical protein
VTDNNTLAYYGKGNNYSRKKLYDTGPYQGLTNIKNELTLICKRLLKKKKRFEDQLLSEEI